MAHRPFNVVAFFIVCAGLARVAAGGRASVPLTWTYLACCLVFSGSDALLGFHVALPVFLASLWWLCIAGGSENRKIAAYAALGMVLVYVGSWANRTYSPFLHSFSDVPTLIVGTAFDEALPSFSMGDVIAGFAAVLGFVVGQGTKSLSGIMLGDKILNGLFFVSVVPLCAWAGLSGAWAKAAQGNTDLKACTMTMLVMMLLALTVSCLALVLFLFWEERYLWMMFWSPFLSFLAIVVAWAMSQEGNRLAIAMAGLVATSLVVDLAFFRHEDVASQRVLCSDDILAGTGFERGMVPYWHAREVGVTGGSGAIHLSMRQRAKSLICLLRPLQETYSITWVPPTMGWRDTGTIPMS